MRLHWVAEIGAPTDTAGKERALETKARKEREGS